MNGIQRYTINLIENEIDQSCPYIEKYKMPDGKWCKYSDVEAAHKAELEACCELLIENGISTGHGSSFTDLIEECIANVLEVSPWIPVSERLPEFKDNYTPEWSDKQVLVEYSDGTKRVMWVHDLHWVVQGIDDILAINPVEWAEIPA